MKYLSIKKQITGKLNWITIRLFIFEISIALMGFDKFSIRLTLSWGW